MAGVLVGKTPSIEAKYFVSAVPRRKFSSARVWPLVEKDAAGTAPARLVFGGGTALSRAHRPIRRMSEDIDLRIISDIPLTRPALRHLRDTITGALLRLHVIWRYNGRQNGK